MGKDYGKFLDEIWLFEQFPLVRSLLQKTLAADGDGRLYEGKIVKVTAEPPKVKSDAED